MGVLWWSEAMDGRPYGPPETTVELPGEITHGLAILRPFGPGSDAMLAVHAVMETGAITLSIDRVIRLDVRPVRRDPDLRAIDRQMQQGTNRNPRAQADGYVDDNGANDDRDD